MVVCLECQSDVFVNISKECIGSKNHPRHKHSVLFLPGWNREAVLNNGSRHLLLVVSDLFLCGYHFVIDRGDIHKVDSMSALGQEPQRGDELVSSATQLSHLHNANRNK